ncbi:MAG: type II CAAX endopeptidase family protein [Pseudomonadota bacterium]
MKKRTFLELFVATSIVILFVRLLVLLSPAWLNVYVQLIVAILLIYTPVVLSWRDKSKLVLADRNMIAFVRSLKIFVITSLIVFPAFFLLAHLWEIVVLKSSRFVFAGFPDFWVALANQILLIALPEEVFFRGYFQTCLNKVCSVRWRILGVDLGWSWIITAIVFATAHSMITYQWWHFSIFFPALLFGYLRERCGSLTAPILFHAASNMFMIWFSRCYG